jgi:hypothetical protein
MSVLIAKQPIYISCYSGLITDLLTFSILDFFKQKKKYIRMFFFFFLKDLMLKYLHLIFKRKFYCNYRKIHKRKVETKGT